jgi:type VI secretion system protein ImpI
MATVRVRVDDAQSGAEIYATFQHLPIRVGRSRLNDLRLAQTYVSQFHVHIDIVNGRILAKDLGTSNGTCHRGRHLEPCRAVDITDDPCLTIGPLSLHVTWLKEADDSAEASGARAETLDELVARIEPHIHHYRRAWSLVSRLIHDATPQLSAADRTELLRRLASKDAIAAESDLPLIAAFHGLSLESSRATGDAPERVREDVISAVETMRTASCPPSS